MSTRFVFLWLVLLLGCQSVAQPLGPSSLPANNHIQLALIKTPSPESHKLLTHAISRAMNGIPVTLAIDVFTKVSRVAIEVGRSNDPRMSSDQLMGRPTVFELVTQNHNCFLKVLGGDELIPLLELDCMALSDSN